MFTHIHTLMSVSFSILAKDHHQPSTLLPEPSSVDALFLFLIFFVSFYMFCFFVVYISFVLLFKRLTVLSIFIIKSNRNVYIVCIFLY